MFYHSSPMNVQKRYRSFSLLLPLALFLLSAGCGYSLRGTGSSLPSHIKKIYISEFENRTPRAELGQIVTTEVMNSFISRSNLTMVGSRDDADGELRGQVMNFSVVPMGVENEGASKYKVIVAVSAELVDLRNGRLLYKNPQFLYEGEYEMKEEGDFLSLELTSLKKISQELATSLVTTLLEGF